MDSNSRSKRHIKKKVIYSPSDPLLPDYYLVNIEKFDEDFIVKKSSIKQQSNGKVLISIGGTEKEGEIITDGTKSHCEAECSFRKAEVNEDELDEEISSVEDDSPIHFLPSSSSKKNIQSYSITPQPRRGKFGLLTTNDQNYYDRHNDMHRSLSDIQLYHKSPSSSRKNNKKTNEDNDPKANEENIEEIFVPGEFSKMINNRIDGMMNSLLASVNKKFDFVTEKINQVYQSSSFGESQLQMYRTENDTFLDKVMHDKENLLDMNGKNPGDYGRRLLRVLYTPQELKTSMLPSTIGARYLKPKLDAQRFELLHSAMRNKYRINKHLYPDFYKNLVRKKLSDFLLEEERRDLKQVKRIKVQQQSLETSTHTILCPTSMPNINSSGSPTIDEE